MKAPRAFPPIRDLIAHREPVIMLDELAECDGESANGRRVFRDGDYGVEAGVVAESALVESLAQLVAAMHGVEARREGREPKGGMLVKIAQFDWHHVVLAGETLDLRVRVEARLGPMIQVVGSAARADVVVAEGKLQFVVGHPAS